MRTFQSHSQPAQRGAAGSLHSLSSSSAVAPLSTASITFTAVVILTLSICNSTSAELQQVTTDQTQLLSQLEAMCSSYLSADMKFWASDVLGELCVFMLIQQSKELKLREKIKRSPVSHPLLHLVSQLHSRREKGLSMSAEIQGPGGIQSRGYFLYRPRNGRRSLENK
ncbi:neuromedin-U isoform X2 [Antennarius striatus]|uniref:neuromedin-U isoform X2 n=1 Tax=Antennarius striatus TaxID=241820 RepID=UPI0035B38A55